MLCSVLKSVCPLQTNIHISVIHQQLKNAGSLRRFPRTQARVVFAAPFGCEKNAGFGPWGRTGELETFSPRNAPAMPGVSWSSSRGAGVGVADAAGDPLSHCELLQRPDERQALRGAKAQAPNFIFQLVFPAPPSPHFPHLSWLRSEF